MNNLNYINLPRGGFLLNTSMGQIQFGSPPETIKDTMKLPEGVPQIFVLPSKFFNWTKGISVAEVEFPIYYNFFLKKRKTQIICNNSQFVKFSAVLQEALFGPEKINLNDDISFFCKKVYTPEIEKEIAFFRNNLTLSDLVTFIPIIDNKFTLNNVKILINNENNFEVYENNIKTAIIPGEIKYNPTYDIGERLNEPFHPPLFGITCLGPSHGFDPNENTSGFILWINRHGIMIDPPVNSTEWLLDSNVNPKLIDSVILTHCHADHDAGTFQKILEERLITVYSTNTVMMSFLRKYSALTGSSPEYLLKLFKFQPIKIDCSEYIHSAKFDFFYSVHSIPVIGFEMTFQNKTFLYTSDHNNDPQLHKKLFDDGIISLKRYNELKCFNWNADIIYHEAGIPPLHTPINWLDSLPPEIKKKTTVYHIANKDFPKDSMLKMAKFGIENTYYIDVETPDYEKPYQILRILKYLDFLEGIPINKASEFISIVSEEKYKKGSIIIKKGTQGDKFYIIYSGNVAVITGEDLEQRKIYGECDYFGEASLVTCENRTADVIAETNVILFTVEKDAFLSFIRGTEFEKALINLAQTRDGETWNLLCTSSFLKILTSTQKTMLESMLNPIDFFGKGIIQKENEHITKTYIIRNGNVKVMKNDIQIALLGKGDIIGSIMKFYKNEPEEFSFIYDEQVSLYYIEKEDMLKFIDHNPGLIMKLVYNFYSEIIL